MVLVRELVDLIATRMGAPLALVVAIADALGHRVTDTADVATAVRLIIGVLATDNPDVAPERVATYAALPMTHLHLANLPHPDGIMRSATVAAEDIVPGSANSADKVRSMKSLEGRLAVDIEALMRGDDEGAVPYMIKLGRRATAPFAFVGVFAKDHSEEIALFRHTTDEPGAYHIASLRMSLYAEIHGIILAEVADLLRGAPSPRPRGDRPGPIAAGGHA